jgi:glycerol-3-phosphate dehydrogenase
MSDASPRQGHIWYHWPGPGCPEHCKVAAHCFPASAPYDVAIVGAGVVGCALAYLLSQHRLRIVVIDRNYDVGEGTSKGNSAIIHTGFDAEPGSLESRLVAQASRQWPGLAARLKIPFKQVAALLSAFGEEQALQLPELRDKAFANGVDDVEILSSFDARRLEPHLSPDVAGALLIPRESIVDPFTTTIAFADVARTNGADFLFGCRVHAVNMRDRTKLIVTDNGLSIPAAIVVNACGLGSRPLVDSYAGEPMTINPRRGQFLVYDKQCSHLVRRILLPMPTTQTKGMLVAPTIFGNVLAGPTAEDLAEDQIDATQTTAEGLAAVRASACRMCPALAEQPTIASYAGLRCNCAEGSYWIRFNDGMPGVVTLAGIRSTGLTASISLAQYVVDGLAAKCGLRLVADDRAVDSRPESRWPGWWRRPYDNPRQTDARPEFASIVCSCENISRGEVDDALELCSGVATLDGLKRRTRVLTGRCQGFNCCVPTAEIISRRFEMPLECITKRGPGSEFIANCQRRTATEPKPARPPSGAVPLRVRVAIIGAGPAGVGAAVGLARAGVGEVLLLDRASQVGGIPAMYSAKPAGISTFTLLRRGRMISGGQFALRLQRKLGQTQTHLLLGAQVLHVDAGARKITFVAPDLGKQEVVADAIVFACGARESTVQERGWIVGRREARQFNTMQLLQLIDGRQALPLERPAIIGSDLVAYSAAAKLRAAGAKAVILCDRSRRPLARWYERLYLGRWRQPRWQPMDSHIAICGDRRVLRLQHDDGSIECDGVVVCGELVPNSELLLEAGLDVGSLSRIPTRRGRHALTALGTFAAGALLGGLHGADWCYQDGKRTAKVVVKYLESLHWQH